MSIRSDTELLGKAPLFADVDPVQLQVLVFSAERLEVAAGETLFAPGNIIGAGYLVLDGQGEVLASASGEGEAPEPVALVETGAFVGERAMIANLPATMTVRARTPLRVLRIGNELFLRVCGEFPEVGERVMEALAHRLETSLEDLRQVQAHFDRARPL